MSEDQVELEMTDTEHHLLMGEALDRLRQNADFQKVIMEGYLREKALASVSMLAVPQIKQAGQRPDVMEDLVAASNLQYWFQTVDSFHEGCKNPILSDEEENELANAQTEGGVQ